MPIHDLLKQIVDGACPIPHHVQHRTMAHRIVPMLFMAAVVSCSLTSSAWAQSEDEKRSAIKIGIIGLDTSHAIAFTKSINKENPKDEFSGCRVVVAYPHGSPDIQSSVSRIPRYTEEIQKLGVKIVPSLDALLEEVDAVLLETNDGRPHLEQAIQVFKAKKPVFIDKPVAGSLTDAVAIYLAANHFNVPTFSSSSLRYTEGAQKIASGAHGDVLGAETYSPCPYEKTHPDLFWYGIHGVETLFTVMGTGCQSVTRIHTPNTDVVVGVWDDGRIGTFRGRRGRDGKYMGGYGGIAFSTKGVHAIGKYSGYDPLLVEIVRFFRTGKVPVTEKETLEIYAFMQAADESKRQNGASVSMRKVLAEAREEAVEKLKSISIEIK